MKQILQAKQNIQIKVASTQKIESVFLNRYNAVICHKSKTKLCVHSGLPQVSPGCPSPTDSDVNMKEPSSSRSLMFVHTQVFGPSLEGKSVPGVIQRELIVLKVRNQSAPAVTTKSVQNSTSVSTWPHIYGQGEYTCTSCEPRDSPFRGSGSEKDSVFW